MHEIYILILGMGFWRFGMACVNAFAFLLQVSDTVFGQIARRLLSVYREKPSRSAVAEANRSTSGM